MRSVDEHLAQALATAAPLPGREVELLDALGCVLDEDVVSGVDLPGFDNSGMDGYAVLAADLAGAGPDSPVSLPVVADIPAGRTDPVTIGAGTVARIMTGAPVPAGADAVIAVEWTDAGTERVSVQRAPFDGQYIRRAGEDVRTGETVLSVGAHLGARQIGLLAAVGRSRVRVRPRPRVVVVSTGSELVRTGQPLLFGQIYDSNGPGLAAAAAELGALARQVGMVADEPAEVLGTLEGALAGADLLVTSGGVSAGAYDTVKEVLGRLGTVRFDRVGMQPGMPQGYGTLSDRDGRSVPIFTLPGNPVSALVSFEVFVAPVLRTMLGRREIFRPVLPAVAGRGWTSSPGRRQFVRGRLSPPDSHGVREVRPVGGHGSHLIAELAEANCLAVVPEDVTEVKPGDQVPCWPLEPEGPW